MIAELRLKQGLSQKELAHRVRFEVTTLANVERGVNNVLAVDLVDYAQALGVSLSRMMEMYQVATDALETEVVKNKRQGHL